MKKLLTALLVLAMAFTMVFATAASAEDGYKDSITWVIGNDQDILDPQNNVSNSKVIPQYYNGLLGYDNDGNVVCKIAESYEASEDKMTWTFHLRQDVYFHSGRHCTAHDFEATFDRLLNTENPQRYTSNASFIDTAVATDDYTFVITLKEPKAFFLQAIARRDIDVSVFDQVVHVAEEERQHQRRNVAAVDVGIGHNNHAAVTQLIEVQRLAVVFGSDRHAERSEDIADLLVLEDPVLHRLLDIQYLTPQRHDSLKIPVAALFGRTACGIALDEENLGLIAIARRAVGQLTGQPRSGQHRFALHEFARLAGRMPGRGGQDHLRHALYVIVEIASVASVFNRPVSRGT